MTRLSAKQVKLSLKKRESKSRKCTRFCLFTLFPIAVAFLIGVTLAPTHHLPLHEALQLRQGMQVATKAFHWSTKQIKSWSAWLILPLPDHALMDFFAKDFMDWSVSTTPVPISSISLLIKRLFSGQNEWIPTGLLHQIIHDPTVINDLNIFELRQHLNDIRYGKLEELCFPASRCVRAARYRDPIFGMTPLHLAYQQGDQKAIQLLLNLGADATVLDVAGRAPQNLSFTSFVYNSKRWAKDPQECMIPMVDANNPKDLPNLSRLVMEGEPVLIRNFLSLVDRVGLLNMAENLDGLIAEHGHVKVRYGQVPYADYFGLPTGETTLNEFYHTFVVNHMKHHPDQIPQYIFQKNYNLTAPFLSILETLVQNYFPKVTYQNQNQSLICPPSHGNAGNASIHYFLGAPGSGAPFHIHADAINLNVLGRKKWFLSPPLQSIYSRKPILTYVERDLEQALDNDAILTCNQEAGDIIYVPFDWGHAVLNEELNFGVALEVLNRRDTFVGWPWSSRHAEC